MCAFVVLSGSYRALSNMINIRNVCLHRCWTVAYGKLFYLSLASAWTLLPLPREKSLDYISNSFLIYLFI